MFNGYGKLEEARHSGAREASMNSLKLNAQALRCWSEYIGGIWILSNYINGGVFYSGLFGVYVNILTYVDILRAW